MNKKDLSGLLIMNMLDSVAIKGNMEHVKPKGEAFL